jgi:hypothetical protein
MTRYYEDKRSLLLELKKQTMNQLSAIEEEDPDRFLHSTELCNPIIDAIESLQMKDVPLTNDQEMEFKGLLQEIAKIHEQLAILIPPFHEKLRQRAMAEKQVKIVNRRYSNGVYGLPSIFLDKKI